MPNSHSKSPNPSASIAPTDTEQRAKIFAALADPTRLRIVELLAGVAGELSGSEIASQAEISLALFCHHSKILLEAGLIQTRKDGQTKYHRLNRSILTDCFSSLVDSV
ncbi:MAG TPA: metalloregulator ArsR/SmtB family transcription factor [Trichocoleus sp.]|jgi:DNA-binding transcriptional ArsR family regulator